MEVKVLVESEVASDAKRDATRGHARLLIASGPDVRELLCAAMIPVWRLSPSAGAYSDHYLSHVTLK